MKDDFTGQIDILKDRINQLESRLQVTQVNMACKQTVVIKIMACGKEELFAKVNALIKDGLYINNIEVSSAEKKDSFAERIEHVINTKFASEDECKTVLKKKATLWGKDSYNEEYIEP